MPGVQILAEVREFSLLHSIQTSSGAQPASYPMGEGLFPGIKQPEHEANHSPPSNDKVKNGGAMPPLQHLQGTVLN
jgi:hypothetical protein